MLHLHRRQILTSAGYQIVSAGGEFQNCYIGCCLSQGDCLFQKSLRVVEKSIQPLWHIKLIGLAGEILRNVEEKRTSG